MSVLDRFGAGWPLLWLAAGFTVVALCVGRARDLTFLSFPLLYLWFMTKRPSQFPRWVFPLVPFVAVAGVGALSALLQFASRALGRGVRPGSGWPGSPPPWRWSASCGCPPTPARSPSAGV